MKNVNETITLTYENILEIARAEARGLYHGDDDEKLATIAARAARRVVYQVVGTYNDAIYTAQRRADEVLNALRGM